MPLIALAYAAYAAGLLVGFSGNALIAVIVAIIAVVVGLNRRERRHIAFAILFVSAVMIGITAEKPGRERFHTPQHGSPLEKIQERASREIDRLFGADAPMARALLIADQHRIPPEMRDRYAKAGMVHMLSISGLHVAIVAGAVMLMFKALRLSHAVASLLAVFTTMVYVAMIGAPPPALRS